MPLFITQGRYTGAAISGMVQSPEDRTEALKKLTRAAGAKLVGWYLTMGEYDFLTITEAPDAATALSAVLAAAAGGSLTDLRTTPAFTSAETMQAFQRASELSSSFRSAGQGTSRSGGSARGQSAAAGAAPSSTSPKSRK